MFRSSSNIHRVFQNIPISRRWTSRFDEIFSSRSFLDFGAGKLESDRRSLIFGNLLSGDAELMEVEQFRLFLALVYLRVFSRPVANLDDCVCSASAVLDLITDLRDSSSLLLFRSEALAVESMTSPLGWSELLWQKPEQVLSAALAHWHRSDERRRR